MANKLIFNFNNISKQKVWAGCCTTKGSFAHKANLHYVLR